MKDSTRETILRYVEHRVPTGGFVQAVLSNDLREAIGRADAENLEDLVEIVRFCYWEIPGPCWGSPEAVREWLAGRVEESEV